MYTKPVKSYRKMKEDLEQLTGEDWTRVSDEDMGNYFRDRTFEEAAEYVLTDSLEPKHVSPMLWDEEHG